MWDFLGGLWSSSLSWLGNTFDSVVDRLLDGLEGLGSWLSSTFGGFFSALTGWLWNLLRPVYWFVGGLLYMLERVIDLAVLVLQVVLMLLQIAFSAGAGLINTFVAFAAWDPATAAPTTKTVFARGVDLVLSKLDAAGFSVVAQVLAVVVWIFALLAIVRILSGRKGG